MSSDTREAGAVPLGGSRYSFTFLDTIVRVIRSALYALSSHGRRQRQRPPRHAPRNAPRMLLRVPAHAVRCGARSTSREAKPPPTAASLFTATVLQLYSRRNRKPTSVCRSGSLAAATTSVTRVGVWRRAYYQLNLALAVQTEACRGLPWPAVAWPVYERLINRRKSRRPAGPDTTRARATVDQRGASFAHSQGEILSLSLSNLLPLKHRVRNCRRRPSQFPGC